MWLLTVWLLSSADKDMFCRDRFGSKCHVYTLLGGWNTFFRSNTSFYVKIHDFDPSYKNHNFLKSDGQWNSSSCIYPSTLVHRIPSNWRILRTNTESTIETKMPTCRVLELSRWLIGNFYRRLTYIQRLNTLNWGLHE